MVYEIREEQGGNERALGGVRGSRCLEARVQQPEPELL